MWRRAVLAVAFLARPLPAQPCEDDPAALAREAERLLSAGEGLERARDLYRRARLSDPSLQLTLRSAELAGAAGDEDDANRLLAEAARSGGELLGPSERLALARQAEARGDRRAAIFQYGHVLTALQRRGSRVPSWVGERIRRLDVEEEAKAFPVRAFPPPSPEAQRAFAEARDSLSRGNGASSRDGFRKALRLSPGYVEAALALGSLEVRSGHVPEAIAAYRTALAADPDRFEAALSLANLLWAEPDRQAKEESLGLLDRAVALRPDLPRLLKDSSDRWAEWGDAARALERLDSWRARAAPEERKATEAGRIRLAERLAQPERVAEAPRLPDLDSPALTPYRLAQVYLKRTDKSSLASALELLAEAERLDPGFAPAPELEAMAWERQGENAKAEEALRRALKGDPARATTHERLAALVEQDAARRSEALGLWGAAERAGSREAVFHLAAEAARSGGASRAAELYRRYLEESPDGPHAEEARRALAARKARERFLERAAAAAGALLAVALAALGLRRLSGETLETWLSREPGQAREIRPILGRLRHEAFKHGGLLLSDGIERLRTGDPGAQRRAAALLTERLFGAEVPGMPMRGLVPEARRALSDLMEAARRRGVRLNLQAKDPLLSGVASALDALEAARGDLAARAASSEGLAPGRQRRLLSRLERAAATLGPATGNRLGRMLDDAASTVVSRGDFERLLAGAAGETGVAPPALQALGLLARENGAPLRVRVERADWETIWRNLFANALAAGRETGSGLAPDLALAVEKGRDAVTGQLFARFILADDVPRPLTVEMIRGRAAERGLGIVADLVRRHEGLVDVGPPPAGAERLRKGIRLEFPALEEEG